MGEIEIQSKIMKVVEAGPISTMEIEKAIREIGIICCPDDLARHLNRLKRNGKITCSFSDVGKGWVWVLSRNVTIEKDPITN
jgi:hypothetical protein